MATGNPHKGLSEQYAALLRGLNDLGLYSAGRIASIAADRQQEITKYTRVRKAMAALSRRHKFAEGGDDMILWEGRCVPAWFGLTWKTTLNQGSRDRKQRAKYQELILRLAPFALYSPENIIQEGMAFGILPATDENLLKASNALFNFRRRRIRHDPDALVPVLRNPDMKTPAWYGWRWLLALPDGCLLLDDKIALLMELDRRRASERDSSIDRKTLGEIYRETQAQRLAEHKREASKGHNYHEMICPYLERQPVPNDRIPLPDLVWTVDSFGKKIQKTVADDSNPSPFNGEHRQPLASSAKVIGNAFAGMEPPQNQMPGPLECFEDQPPTPVPAPMATLPTAIDSFEENEQIQVPDASVENQPLSRRLSRTPRFYAAIAAFITMALLVTQLVRTLDGDQVSRLAAAPDHGDMQRLLALWQEETDPLQRAYIASGLTQAAQQLPDQRSIAALREVVNANDSQRGATVAAIAALNRELGRSPLALAGPSEPIMSAAFAENSLVLYPEGLLQPGDWLSIGLRVGYVQEIQRQRILVRFEDQTETINFRPPRVLGHIPPKLGKLTCWDGTMNLHAVLTAVAQIQGKRFNASGNTPGHVGGTFLIEDYHAFLDFLEETLSLDITDSTIRLPHSQAPQIVAYEPVPRPRTIKKHLLDYAAQCGLSPEFLDLPFHFESAAVFVEGLQLQDILLSQGNFFIRATPDNRLVIQRERGIP